MKIWPHTIEHKKSLRSKRHVCPANGIHKVEASQLFENLLYNFSAVKKTQRNGMVLSYITKGTLTFI